ncbi:MAG: fibrobacter succinogenes major paralogous domain-containing protein [Fibrobacter sp.]|nr:fibrobacter succinogenes major paralogous domain-containing protein [Fibrobacter sp.]
MTDSRDGQTYKTVKIGAQTWMAENLNYAYTDVSYNYSDNTSDSTSWCYNDSVEYCVKYGRLYTWAAAMDSAGTWTTNGKGCGYDSEACSPTYPVRGICPEGWHLPSEDEWKRLITAVGGSSTTGQMLKSTGGWNKISGYVDSGNGIDAYSFSALPAGYRNYSGYKDEGRNADFWVSTKNSGYFAYAMSLTSTVFTGLGNTFIGDGYSVRCVKDESETAPE